MQVYTLACLLAVFIGAEGAATYPRFDDEQCSHDEVLALGRYTHPVFFLFFNPSCPHCKAVLPFWRKLHEATRTVGSPARVCTIDCSGPAKALCPYFKVRAYPFALYSAPSLEPPNVTAKPLPDLRRRLHEAAADRDVLLLSSVVDRSTTPPALLLLQPAASSPPTAPNSTDSNSTDSTIGASTVLAFPSAFTPTFPPSFITTTVAWYGPPAHPALQAARAAVVANPFVRFGAVQGFEPNTTSPPRFEIRAAGAAKVKVVRLPPLLEKGDGVTSTSDGGWSAEEVATARIVAEEVTAAAVGGVRPPFLPSVRSAFGDAALWTHSHPLGQKVMVVYVSTANASMYTPADAAAIAVGERVMQLCEAAEEQREAVDTQWRWTVPPSQNHRVALEVVGGTAVQEFEVPHVRGGCPIGLVVSPAWRAAVFTHVSVPGDWFGSEEEEAAAEAAEGVTTSSAASKAGEGHVAEDGERVASGHKHWPRVGVMDVAGGRVVWFDSLMDPLFEHVQKEVSNSAVCLSQRIEDVATVADEGWGDAPWGDSECVVSERFRAALSSTTVGEGAGGGVPSSSALSEVDRLAMGVLRAIAGVADGSRGWDERSITLAPAIVTRWIGSTLFLAWRGVELNVPYFGPRQFPIPRSLPDLLAVAAVTLPALTVVVWILRLLSTCCGPSEMATLAALEATVASDVAALGLEADDPRARAVEVLARSYNKAAEEDGGVEAHPLEDVVMARRRWIVATIQAAIAEEEVSAKGRGGGRGREGGESDLAEGVGSTPQEGGGERKAKGGVRQRKGGKERREE